MFNGKTHSKWAMFPVRFSYVSQAGYFPWHQVSGEPRGTKRRGWNDAGIDG